MLGFSCALTIGADAKQNKAATPANVNMIFPKPLIRILLIGYS